METTMHNIMPQNQLSGWTMTDHSYSSDSWEQKLDEYYECIVECSEGQPMCKRLCNEILR